MKFFIVLFFSILLSAASFATSCQGTTSFCTLQKTDSTSAILAGVILSEDSNYISFKVFDGFRGTKSGDTVIIWDYYYSWFTLGVDTIKANQIGSVGDSLLLLLPIIDSAYADTTLGNVGDFLAPLVFCTEPILRINNGFMRGNIFTDDPGFVPPPPAPIPAKVIDTLNYQDFVNSWKTSGSNDSLCQELAQLVGIKKLILETEFEIFPNPVKETFHLESSANEKLSFQLYNLMGQVVLLRSPALRVPMGDRRRENRYEFSVGHLPKGIYFLNVIDSDERATIKILKE